MLVKGLVKVTLSKSAQDTCPSAITYT